MNELLDNILVLVPVALLIFLRVFAEGARKRVEKTRKTAAAAEGEDTTAAVRTGAQARPWNASPKARSGETTKPPAGKPQTARRDLLGRLRNYLAGDPDKANQRLEPLHFEEEAARRLSQPGSRAAGPTLTAGSTSTKAQTITGYREGLPGAMEEEAAAARESVRSYSFPARLERLSPLKRAIVLSEVLGKPKSMQ